MDLLSKKENDIVFFTRHVLYPILQMHVFGLWEAAGIPRENPHGRGKNMQTPQEHPCKGKKKSHHPLPLLSPVLFEAFPAISPAWPRKQSCVSLGRQKQMQKPLRVSLLDDCRISQLLSLWEMMGFDWESILEKTLLGSGLKPGRNLLWNQFQI